MVKYEGQLSEQLSLSYCHTYSAFVSYAYTLLNK